MLKILILILIFYLLISINEWLIHKYLMHKCNKNIILNFIDFILKKININLRINHLNHHNVNNVDGSITDLTGIFFNKYYKFITPNIILFYFIILNKFLNFKLNNNNYLVIYIILFIIAYIYEISWNIIHPKYHRVNNTFNKNGFLENTKIYKYLQKYHMIHHFNKGDLKTNYNIVLPGADHLFGTYKDCIDNKEYCKNHKFDSDKNKKLCENEENNIQLPYDIKYCKNK
tara:strand:+ start:25 stop:714 length:690 start_codon:yes stop_codon:yes gene_type:complete